MQPFVVNSPEGRLGECGDRGAVCRNAPGRISFIASSSDDGMSQ